MEPFTQRLLERAKARKDKLDLKISPSKQTNPRRKILTESNQPLSPTKHPSSPMRQNSNPIEKNLTYGGTENDESDFAVKINIVHQNNVQVQVEVEEREVDFDQYLAIEDKENSLERKKNDELNADKELKVDSTTDKASGNMREGTKTRLQKLGKLYSENGRLSSPIYQSRDLNLDEGVKPSVIDIQEESEEDVNEKPRVKKFGRLAALANQINNWEDDTSHHDFKSSSNATKVSSPKKSNFTPAPVKTASPIKSFADRFTNKSNVSPKKQSIFSKSDVQEKPKVTSPFASKFSKFNKPDITENNRVVKESVISSPSKKIDERKPIALNNSPKPFQPQVVATSPKKLPRNWDRSILEDLEAKGFKRASETKTRLVYEFEEAGGMGAACVDQPPLDRKPSTKKRPAPPPPPQPTSAAAATPLASSEGERSNSSSSSPYGTPEPERRPDDAPAPASAALLRRDPLQMSVRERKAFFERRAGRATELPKNNVSNSKPKVTAKPTNIVPVHIGFKAHIIAPPPLTISEKEITDKIKKDKENDMKVIFNRYQGPDLDIIEQDTQDDLDTENSPLMGNNNANHKSSTTNLSAKRQMLVNSPKVIINNGRDKPSVNDMVDAVPVKRISVDSPLVISTLEDVKNIKVAPAKSGHLYPCLSDIEGQSEEEKQSCPASLNNSLDSAVNEHADDEDWGNTSFGRDVLQAAGVKRTPMKMLIKTKAKSAEKRILSRKVEDSSDESFNNDNMDDVLDEAFDFEEDDGPTPPKVNKNGTQASNSFHYKKGSEVLMDKFKSPLKTPPKGRPSFIEMDEESKKPLVHTVSFYRRVQNQGSQQNTPVRVIRNECDNNEEEEKEANIRHAQVSAQESRRRIKELYEEVAKQNTIVSQASQALNLCVSTIEFSGSTEQAEGERLLLLASHRRQSYMHEAQRIQVEGVKAPSSHIYNLSIEKLCLPLRREYVRQLNAEGALGHYLVCLIKCQERVLATSLNKSVPELFTVTFPDKFLLEGLDADFKVTVEVYILQASKEVLPHDVKYHIATKKSGKLTTPRKGARGADLRAPPPIASPGGPSAVRSPAMQPQGYCIFSLQQTNRNSFTLSKLSGVGPLEGCVRVKLSCQKRVSQNMPLNVKRGFLTMFEEAGGFGAWHRRWCVLHSGDLSYWRYPDDEKKKTPMGSIELTTAISESVGPAPRDLCARPHTLLLETTANIAESTDNSRDQSARSLIMSNGRRRYLLAADTKIERDTWAKALNETLSRVKESSD